MNFMNYSGFSLVGWFVGGFFVVFVCCVFLVWFGLYFFLMNSWEKLGGGKGGKLNYNRR